MTKKDYTLIAEALVEGYFQHIDMIRAKLPKQCYKERREVFQSVIEHVAFFLKRDNPAFSVPKFSDYIVNHPKMKYEGLQGFTSFRGIK